MKFCKLYIFVLYFYAHLCIIIIVSLFNCLTNTILQKHENDKNCRYFVLILNAKERSKIKVEDLGQVLKSIGFPAKVLACTDAAAANIYRTSRSALVIRALREFIKNNNLEEKTGIKI